MAGKRKSPGADGGSVPPVVSTLPPKDPPKAARRRKLPDDLPKGDLPAPKRKRADPAPAVQPEQIAKSAKSPRKAKPSAPVWDPKAEAAAARSAVASRAKREAGPIIPPPGAIHIPGVTVRREPMPHGGALKRSKKDPEPPVRTTAPKKGAAAEKPAAKVPVRMTDALFKAICLEISEGIPLRQICRRPDMPSKSAVYEYLDGADLDGEDPRSADERGGRLARYARARKLGYDALAEESLEIADDGTNDWIEREREDGRIEEVLDRDHVQRSKLRIETRLKLLAVWDPKRYGNMVKIGDPDAKPIDSASKSASDLAIGMAKLLVAARREAEAQGEAE